MRLLTSDHVRQAPSEVTQIGRSFDPFQPSYVADPYPELAHIQSAEPVFYAAGIDSWVVTDYAAVRAILRDPARFSASVASDPLTPLCPEARAIIADSEFDVPGLLVNNGSPTHPHCRKFFGEPLKPNHLVKLEPFIHATVNAVIDQMLKRGPPADLASGLTWDVPALVLFRLLGVPDEDVPRVKAYADSRVVLLWGRPSKEEQVRLTRGALEFFRYTARLVHARMEMPEDDYPSAVLRNRGGDDQKATIRDIIAVTFNLLFAGHETTSSASANILSTVLQEPGLWPKIAAGEVNIDKLVEEGLRFDPPVQAWRRLATEDVEVAGMKIPAGSHVLLHFGAANRDPNKFACPARFDIDRENAGQHVSFGMGAHFCLGAPLAKLEIATMIRLLAKRIPTLAVSADQSPDYLPNTSFRGLRHLKVIW